MSDTYEIYADEAWTHCNPPLNRYWCFHGGIYGKQPDLDRFETELKTVLADYNINGEMKWSSLSEANYNGYAAAVDCLFTHIKNGHIKYRQSFLDRTYVYNPKHSDKRGKDLDTQFKIYYQFLKHSFGLKFLPKQTGGTSILVRLDNHSSQNHKDDLVAFAEDLPAILGRTDLTIRVTFHNSKKVRKLQICDLVMGAAGSYGNKMHVKRDPGQWGMKTKQRLRLDLCKHIYNHLRLIDAHTRGTKAFNWFESTGLNGDIENMLHHSIRIWKIIPKRHLIDKGWQNDHLDKYGNYQGPDLVKP